VPAAVRNVCVLRRIAFVLVVLPALTLVGCGSGSSDKDLGRIIYDVPKVPGSEKTFPMPELDPKAKSDQPDNPFGLRTGPPADTH
jgi:hypothetical protein